VEPLIARYLDGPALHVFSSQVGLTRLTPSPVPSDPPRKALAKAPKGVYGAARREARRHKRRQRSS
jgi:hypothetical protein